MFFKEHAIYCICTSVLHTHIYLYTYILSLAVYSQKGKFTIVPVLVGALREDREASYGKLFSKYLTDPENLFVISSDFCHWGEL